MGRPVPGQRLGRHSLSKAPRAREHILTDSWNCHKYVLPGGVHAGEWEVSAVSGHARGRGRAWSVTRAKGRRVAGTREIVRF